MGGSGGGRGGEAPAKHRLPQAKPVSSRGYGNTDEMKAARALDKLFSRGDFQYSLFAHYLVQHSSGYVLNNLFSAFSAIIEAMAERFDANDINDTTEFELGVASKRIMDAMDSYKRTY